MEHQTIKDCLKCTWYGKESKLCGFNYDEDSHGTFTEFADEEPGQVELLAPCDCFKEEA
jgi:hypothetical protein